MEEILVGLMRIFLYSMNMAIGVMNAVMLAVLIIIIISSILRVAKHQKDEGGASNG